jgi:hypothetical protein
MSNEDVAAQEAPDAFHQGEIGAGTSSRTVTSCSANA